MEPTIDKQDIERIQKITRKSVDILTTALKVFNESYKKSPISPQDFIHIFKDITPSDINWAVKFLKKSYRNEKKKKTTQQILNEKSLTVGSGNTLPEQTVFDTSIYLFHAFLKTSYKQKYPTADELLNYLQIKDEKLMKKFHLEYNDVVKHTETLYKKDPYYANLIRWSIFGKIFFYGGIVVIILIILRKIYEYIIIVSDNVRVRLRNMLKVPRSRYILNVLSWTKQKLNKKKPHKSIKVANDRVKQFFSNSKSRKTNDEKKYSNNSDDDSGDDSDNDLGNDYDFESDNESDNE